MVMVTLHDQKKADFFFVRALNPDSSSAICDPRLFSLHRRMSGEAIRTGVLDGDGGHTDAVLGTTALSGKE